MSGSGGAPRGRGAAVAAQCPHPGQPRRPLRPAAAMGRGAAPLRRLLLSLLLLPAAGAPGASLTLGEPETAEELMEYRDPCKAGREAGWLQLWEKFGSAAADRCPCEALRGTPAPPGRSMPRLTWRRREPPGPAGSVPGIPLPSPTPRAAPLSPAAAAGGFGLPPACAPLPGGCSPGGRLCRALFCKSPHSPAPLPHLCRSLPREIPCAKPGKPGRASHFGVGDSPPAPSAVLAFSVRFHCLSAAVRTCPELCPARSCGACPGAVGARRGSRRGAGPAALPARPQPGPPGQPGAPQLPGCHSAHPLQAASSCSLRPFLGVVRSLDRLRSAGSDFVAFNLFGF